MTPRPFGAQHAPASLLGLCLGHQQHEVVSLGQVLSLQVASGYSYIDISTISRYLLSGCIYNIYNTSMLACIYLQYLQYIYAGLHWRAVEDGGEEADGGHGGEAEEGGLQQGTLGGHLLAGQQGPACPHYQTCKRCLTM